MVNMNLTNEIVSSHPNEENKSLVHSRDFRMCH